MGRELTDLGKKLATLDLNSILHPQVRALAQNLRAYSIHQYHPFNDAGRHTDFISRGRRHSDTVSPPRTNHSDNSDQFYRDISYDEGNYRHSYDDNDSMFYNDHSSHTDYQDMCR